MNVLRTLLFFVICVGVRLWIAFGVKTVPSTLHKHVAFGLGMIALGFATIYTFDLRKSGSETFGEPNIWWDNLRPVHAAMYGIAAMYTMRGHTELAFQVLVLDTIIGALATAHRRLYLKT